MQNKQSAEFGRSLVDLVLLTCVLAITLLEFGCYFVVFPVSQAGYASLIAVAAFTAPLHYGLMHKTMHGNLFPSSKWDRPVGRLLGIALGLPWETMRFGHLAHHGLNRHKFDRPELYDARKSYWLAAAEYFGKLVIGNALIYALFPCAVLLPISTTNRLVSRLGSDTETAQFRAAAVRAFSNRSWRRAIRVDLLAIFLLFGCAAYVWHAHWYVFAACVIARWSILSLLDNAPHYDTALTAGASARNSYLPLRISWLLLNQNYHGVHHQNPGRHWQALPNKFGRDVKEFDGTWVAAILRQFKGQLPIDGERRAS